MVVCSGVAIRLCRDKAWAISPGSAAEQASNAPFSDLNKSFQAFLKTFEIASKIFRKTGTNSGGFSVSRNGDCGNRLAAGEILRLRTACRGGCDKVWVSGSTKAFVKPFVKNLINGQK